MDLGEMVAEYTVMPTEEIDGALKNRQHELERNVLAVSVEIAEMKAMCTGFGEAHPKGKQARKLLEERQDDLAELELRLEAVINFKQLGQ